MKTLLAILILASLTACFGAKSEQFQMSAPETLELMSAHEQALAASFAVQQAQREYQRAFAEFQKSQAAIRQAHKWPEDLSFDGREWKKQAAQPQANRPLKK